MLGRKMHTALKALQFASEFHTGKRKDNCTPEYYHQLSIALYLRSLMTDDSGFLHPEETLAAACLHDVCEDYDVGYDELETKFGKLITQSVICLTKEYRGEKILPSVYYERIGKDSIASLVKGADRIDNNGSMVNVFTFEKQKSYIQETTEYILPMLKVARRTFTKQEPAYMNIKFVLTSQINLIQAIHLAANK